jgi:cell division protein FtsW (lipid II flippase)
MMAGRLTTVYSATYDANSACWRRLLNMAVGLCVMWAVAQLPPQKLMRFGVPLYVLGVSSVDSGVFLRDQGQWRHGAGCRSALPAFSRRNC